MTMPGRPGLPDQPDPAERSEQDVRLGRAERRRERVYQQIKKDRAGNHKIPTWVYATILGLVLAGWLYLIITS
ncbi:hypothetical protein [Actinoplanes sp. DH11]|uniref:hypothetical protein n=1 Tax=Actinoplanes sp. DH11 TaxID=2857011 RepID=UPI001E3B24AB|nr:hypothetical protein [Actinoplanes sp. DH11]